MFLEKGDVTEISIDHDLRYDEHSTGYDVVLWVEEAVAVRDFKLPMIQIHRATSAEHKMSLSIANIALLSFTHN